MSKSKKDVVAEVVPAIVDTTVYTLGEKALGMAMAETVGDTKQRLFPKQKDWRSAGKLAPNTRAKALAVVLAQCGDTFTADQVMVALKDAKALDQGASWTPASRFKAFVANGYFAKA
jgi:hypothetical protein